MSQPPRLADYHRRLKGSTIGAGLRRPSATDQPLVSVVTVCRDAADLLERTIDSIAAQDYANLEYILVDGASTDGTTDLIRARRADVSAWISEPDGGIADAFNKGLAISRGDYISFLNADDWLEPEHIARAVQALTMRADAALAYGDVTLHGAAGSVTRVVRGRPRALDSALLSMAPIPHPGLLAHRRCFEQAGLFRTDLVYCMDYDWILRVKRCGFRACHVPGLTAHMREGGLSSRNPGRRDRENRDIALSHREASATRVVLTYGLRSLANRWLGGRSGGPAAGWRLRIRNRLLGQTP